jgi:predicted RNA binding protein YcfA (HicA-like mRNA interferase family)
MKGYYQQVTTILKRYGFSFLKPGKGSHEIWSNGTVNMTVPFNCKSRHTANGILKDAGAAERV